MRGKNTLLIIAITVLAIIPLIIRKTNLSDFENGLLRGFGIGFVLVALFANRKAREKKTLKNK